NADEVLADFARDVRDDLVPVIQLDAELRVRQGLRHLTLHLDAIFSRHATPSRADGPNDPRNGDGTYPMSDSRRFRPKSPDETRKDGTQRLSWTCRDEPKVLSVAGRDGLRIRLRDDFEDAAFHVPADLLSAFQQVGAAKNDVGHAVARSPGSITGLVAAIG